MLVTESRPRNLHWKHAGPLLYGDWGTSRLYVLGLAFFFTAHASVIYLAAIGILMLAVSWAYTIVCRGFPDGGGVYTAARKLSPTVSVVGATLLLSGYIMTAAISVVEAFHYFGVPHHLTLPLSLVTIALVGVVNWFGAKAAGRFALVIAFGALAVSGVLFFLCLPFFFEGIRTINFDYFREHSIGTAWVSFTSICLALAGVEAVANMTGLMKKPVDKTAKKTIWPVTIEVVALNLVFGIALAGLNFTVNGTTLAEQHGPHSDLILADPGNGHDAAGDEAALDLPPTETEAEAHGHSAGQVASPETTREIREYRDTAMKVVARQSTEKIAGYITDEESAETIGFVGGKIAGITFGLLLLSATNTATMAMVSVLYAMAHDRELPRALTKLNYSGVPKWGLLVALIIPAAVITVERDVEVLAKLYVLGVCGAITVTITSCVLNKELEVSKFQRGALAALGLFLFAISATIAVTELVSTAFSGSLIAIALLSRWLLTLHRRSRPEPLPEPAVGWLAELRDQKPEIDATKPKIMLAARGRHQAEFAVDLARRRRATLFTIFVRPVRVLDYAPDMVPKIEEDPDAQAALGSVAILAKANGVPFVPIYVIASDIPSEILDYTVTFGCDTIILGKSRRSVFARKLEGDVVTSVAESLPDDVALITRSADTPHASKLKMPEAEG